MAARNFYQDKLRSSRESLTIRLEFDLKTQCILVKNSSLPPLAQSSIDYQRNDVLNVLFILHIERRASLPWQIPFNLALTICSFRFRKGTIFWLFQFYKKPWHHTWRGTAHASLASWPVSSVCMKKVSPFEAESR